MFWYECEICGAQLDEDHSCPLCDEQDEVAELFVWYEKYVLGWMTSEEYDINQFGWFTEDELAEGLQNSFYSEEHFRADTEFLERLLWMDENWECSCPLCMGQYAVIIWHR